MAKLRPVGDWIADRFEIFAVHPGGMGVVYVAHDHFGPAGRKVVAIKTLRDEWLSDNELSARFAAECEIWVRLGSHPHIVHAHEVGEFDGKPHIVLELVTGGDLRRKIGSGELDVLKVLRLGVQFCLGMEHANRQGMTCHRDVKPGNLMLSGDGTLKITDFGLAVIRDEMYAGEVDPYGVNRKRTVALAEVAGPVAVVPDLPADRSGVQRARRGLARLEFAGPEDTLDYSPEGSDEADSPLLRLTQTGSLMGTMPYMAPEQFRDSKGVDVRADVYAFGIVLFQLLTGELPFHGKTLARLDRAHAQYSPPSVVPAIPRKYAREARAIDAIVQRCLRKERDERQANMEELRRDLAAILRRIER